jgi:hypothetical protein
MRRDNTWSTEDLRLAKERLEATDQDVRACLVGATTAAEANAKLDELRKRARRNYRKWAHQLHPDKAGDDPAKDHELKCLSAVYNDLKSLEVNARPRPQPRPRPQGVTIVVGGFGGFGGFGGSTTTTGSDSSTVSGGWVRYHW